MVVNTVRYTDLRQKLESHMDSVYQEICGLLLLRLGWKML